MPINDDGSNKVTPYVEAAVTEIIDFLAGNPGRAVLIHCRMGVSRSATVAAGFLMVS